MLGWRAPGVLEADVPALDVASAILGLGRGSRLARLVREPGLANSIGVSSYGVVDVGVFAIGAELAPARLEQVLAIIGATVRDLAAQGPDPAELDRARALMLSQIGRRLEQYESRALALADADALGDVTRLDREASDVLAVTPTDVRDAARRWLMADAVSGVAYLPRNTDAQFDADTLTGAMHTRGHPECSKGLPGSARHEPPAFAANVTTGRGVHHLEMDGIDILTARFGETGQTTVSVYRPRSVLETPSTAGIAALAIRAMLRGTARLDAAELAFTMESLGGSLSPVLGADVLGFGATVLSEHVRAVADLLAEVLLQPRFDAHSVAIERGLLLEDARAVADDMVRFPVQLALGVAFNNTGYGSPALGTPESVAGFDVSTVRAWHASMLRGGRTTIVAVGDDEPDRVADVIASAVAAV